MIRLLLALALTGAVAAPAAAASLVVNGGFEQPGFRGTAYNSPLESQVPGWMTTASDNRFEFWSNGFNGVAAFEGAQHVELNANEVSSLFQEIAGVAPGSVLSFAFAHRGRSGPDSLLFTLTDLGTDGLFGGGDDTVLFSQAYVTGNSGWALYAGGGILALGNRLRLSFNSISSTGGPTYGNFLDAVSLEAEATTALTIPAPAGIGLVVVALGGLALAWRRGRRNARA